MAEGGSFTAMLLHGFGEESVLESLATESRGSFNSTVSTSDLNRLHMTSIDRTVVCAGCGERVYDRYFLLALDKQWHSGCLRCSLCQSTLDSHLSCFCKDGTIYCKEDYYRQFCVERCAHCGLGIPSSELVMRVRDYVFHLRCFNCQSCGSALQTGDLFTMQGCSLLCQRHCSSALSPTEHPPKPRLRKRKTVNLDNEQRSQVDLVQQEDFLGCREPHLTNHQGEGLGTKTKRIRTCFKNHQLRTMESYFAVKHNPDGKDWEQLAKKTGLPKRVLQVWFQNARAKLRKTMSSEDPSEGEGSVTSTTSTIDPSQISFTSTSPRDTSPVLESMGQPVRMSSPFLSFPEFASTYLTQSTPIMTPIFLNFDLGESTPSNIDDSGPASFF
ncbi:LIM/homeobox protein Lhx2-like isoform X1 [Erpetoichthys calabaricus]|uniref:LIM/homeobox protein Lhx2-like isoform X1 n=1 Tax=Erpetoichthys calabaricus TaxID=27687 RepID=UPI002233F83B|nr:LIM/homeobox protein Lhx2-like isoform X1 [Erpetoichthys calabaricus]